jgi:sterol desaturase/sphingolipid hydroxylase (fatty acid hydroxylase superfamily)
LKRNLSGPIHLLINGSILFSQVIIFTLFLEQPSLIEMLVIPIMLILGNLGVWAIHKYLLHKKGLSEYAYQRHTIEHHTSFTHDNFAFKDKVEFENILFPVKVIVSFTFVFIPIIFVLTGYFLNYNARLLVLICSSSYFILYEFFHTCSHLRDDHFMLRIKPLRFMSNFHRLHHNRQHMSEYNFGIVSPVADIILGTYFRH